LYGSDYPADALQLLRHDLRHFIDKNYIAELKLLDYKVLNVILTYILLCQTVPTGKLIPHAESVHHSYYTVQTRISVGPQSRIHPRHRAYRPGYRLRLAYPAGLYHYIVELLRSDKLEKLLHQVCLERTAYTAVLQRHKTVVLRAHHSSFLNQGGIDIHLSQIIYYHCESDSLPVG